MKPFNLIWSKKSFYKGKTRIIGITYHKTNITGEFGTRKILTFYYWKKYKVFNWI